MGTPARTGVPSGRTKAPSSVRTTGTLPPRQESECCYAAGGKPLAVTQGTFFSEIAFHEWKSPSSQISKYIVDFLHYSSFPENCGRILPALTWTSCKPLNVIAGRFLTGFGGRK